jgi:hypothetical protein
MGLKLFPTSNKEAEAIEKINRAKNKLESVEKELRELVLSKLELRLNEFRYALTDATLSASEKRAIIEQYNRFASTFLKCVTSPNYASAYVNSYLAKEYYPVAITELEPTNPWVRRSAMAGIFLSSLLLLAAIPAFIINPVIGGLLICLAITLLLPCSYVLLIPQQLNTEPKKSEERALFLEAADLVKPEAEHDEYREFYRA